jgi:hypothetical protein
MPLNHLVDARQTSAGRAAKITQKINVARFIGSS